MASVYVRPDTPRQDIESTIVYGPKGAPVKLRIATGGAGQSGLLRALAEAYIESMTNTLRPFRIAWIATDTSMSFNALATGAADLSITYHESAEQIALKQGIAEKRVYAWRDHFMLVGPRSNPANLPTDHTLSIFELFALVFQAAIATQGLDESRTVRYLSRFDKSANNIRESFIWTTIGQTPWSHPYSTWYHRYVDFPFGALRAASQLGEYTLVDRGSWYAIEPEVRERMIVFKESFNASPEDPLINPAHALVGRRARSKERARSFVDWLSSSNGGQSVVKNFAKNGVVLHSPAPTETEAGPGKGFTSKL